ncbi:hypothetical protein IAT38_000929 [Cryptococcus sp. DSM 104549]
MPSPVPTSRKGASPVPSSAPQSQLSPSTTALLALTQDISALLSLSFEATASTVHDWFRSGLGTIGIGEVVPAESGEYRGKGESGRGLAVVIVGASEATGQSLTLHLAKSGYTVFPFVPLPSPSSPPTSGALSHLLLTWSGIQKRLRARHPNHPGAVVPVIVDPEGNAEDAYVGELKKDPAVAVKEGGSRFGHAGETVRAYCRDNGLSLVAIVCASRKTKSYQPQPGHSVVQGISGANSKTSNDDEAREENPLTASFAATAPSTFLPLHPGLPHILPATALSMASEDTLLSLYRTNVLDPLCVIRELSDLLSSHSPVPGDENSSSNRPRGRGRGRVIFVNGGSGVGISELEDDQEVPDGGGSGLGVGVQGAIRMIGAARSEGAKLLREELEGAGIDVCEVVVGPMSPRVGTVGHNLRQGSEDETDPDAGRRKIINEALQNSAEHPVIQDASNAPTNSQAVLASRLSLLSRIWAVDDALLYSSVRRAIEDRYPRYRHHAGLSPLLNDLAEGVPGGGIIRYLGRWMVGRLLTPRSGS